MPGSGEVLKMILKGEKSHTFQPQCLSRHGMLMHYTIQYYESLIHKWIIRSQKKILLWEGSFDETFGSALGSPSSDI